MLVLDENLPDGQQQLLRKARIRFRVIGIDVGASGTQDENLIPLLHRLARPTFFSLDRNFYRPVWANTNYCLAWLDVKDDRAAEFIRRFLRHPLFDTQAKRMGKVVRVHTGALVAWEFGKRVPNSFVWPTSR